MPGTHHEQNTFVSLNPFLDFRQPAMIPVGKQPRVAVSLRVGGQQKVEVQEAELGESLAWRADREQP